MLMVLEIQFLVYVVAEGFLEINMGLLSVHFSIKLIEELLLQLRFGDYYGHLE